MCEQPEKEQIKYKKRKRFERRKRNQANGETRRHIYQRIFLGETNTSRTSVIIYVIMMRSLLHLCVYGYVHYLTISFFRPVSHKTANRHTHFFFVPSSFCAVSTFSKTIPSAPAVCILPLSLFTRLLQQSIDRRSRTLSLQLQPMYPSSLYSIQPKARLCVNC